MKKSNVIKYRACLIEVRQVNDGWATSFRKYADTMLYDIGDPFPSKREAVTHAKSCVDAQINEELIASQFEELFVRLLQQNYPVGLIFEGLATAIYDLGWSEVLGDLEEKVKGLPGAIR